jgi:hypothetical protein
MSAVRILVSLSAASVAALALTAPPATGHPPGVTERVSVGPGGVAADNDAQLPAISGDGRFVAFASSATNLVNSDKNNAVDIFLRDRLLGTTERVTQVGRKTVANAESSFPAISPDARFVAFKSFADDLVPNDTNFTSRFVAFNSLDDGLVPGYTNKRLYACQDRCLVLARDSRASAALDRTPALLRLARRVESPLPAGLAAALTGPHRSRHLAEAPRSGRSSAHPLELGGHVQSPLEDLLRDPYVGRVGGLLPRQREVVAVD